MGICHLAHVLTVPPTKTCILCATPAGLDLYIQAMPVGTYRVQSPGFPKIVYYVKGKLCVMAIFTFVSTDLAVILTLVKVIECCACTVLSDQVQTVHVC